MDKKTVEEKEKKKAGGVVGRGGECEGAERWEMDRIMKGRWKWREKRCGKRRWRRKMRGRRT